MGYTNFIMRLDDSLHANVYPILEQYGLTPSQAVRMFFNQIANTGKVPLSFDWAGRVPNNATLSAIEAVERGEVTTYDAPEEAMQAMIAIASSEG